MIATELFRQEIKIENRSVSAILIVAMCPELVIVIDTVTYGTDGDAVFHPAMTLFAALG
ncbi:hypothetical protein [Mesorhizobium sp. RMAD-H1]|uniref:hypothetical protein n=1 Tax=Mesorhizobium sp. RMAD-H1 TaxID=2587065 RepID=UPI00161DC3AC|nr:hypothetical protein [Mesorhizobium sp. RMAD-H1]MBB2973925.1 hypothetical protein [Mesorhizobium sp. RMAD-H1]